MQTLDSVRLGTAPERAKNAFFYYSYIMAKSKSGGTRTFIRGRVGSDVYSVGRDAKGKKQQVVRSLAESVSNPQTLAQMRGRMIMSTIAQALAALRPICDHSFDNVVGARANLAEFTSRNYALIKADVAANPATGNAFGLNKYGEKGAKRGAYVIADGQANIPSALQLTKSTAVIVITLPSDNITMGGLKSALGMTSEEYFTLVGLTAAGAAQYERFRINGTIADSTAITAENVAGMFAVEGNVTATVALAGQQISLTISSIAGCCAVIVSKKSNGKFIHNEAVLGDANSFDYPSDTALPTYPVGAQNYLNGGDIFGLTERAIDGDSNPNNGGGDAPQQAENQALTISISGSGSASVKNASNQEITSGGNVLAGSVVSVEITPESGKQGTAQINGTSVSLTLDNGKYVGTFNMPNQASTLTINTAYTSGGGSDGLDMG